MSAQFAESTAILSRSGWEPEVVSTMETTSAEVNMNDKAISMTAATIGERFLKAREAQHLRLEDVARTLKLSPHQVAMLESGEWDLLTGLTFTRGMLRSYARILELDGDAILDEATRQGVLPAIGSQKTPESIPFVMAARLDSRALLVKLSIVALLIAVVLIWVWPGSSWFVQENRFDSTAGAILSESGSGAAATEMSGSSATLLPAETQAMIDRTPPADEHEADGAIESKAAEAVPITAATTAAAEAVPVAVPMIFTVATPAWIEVRDPNNQILMSEIVKSGKRDLRLGVPPYTIVIGNARQVTMSYDGQPVDIGPFIASSGVARLTLPVAAQAESKETTQP